MSENITNAKNALETLSNAVRDGWSEDRTFQEVWGWNFPLVDRFDLKNLADDLSEAINDVDDEKISESFDRLIKEIVERANLFRNNSLQYLYNGNGSGAVPVYVGMLQDFKRRLRPFLKDQTNWEEIKDKKEVPTAILKRIRSVSSQLEDAEKRAGDIEQKIATIDEAHEAAEALPTDLASLREARQEIEGNNKVAQSFKTRAEEAAKNAEAALQLLVEKHNDAEKLIASLEDAYSAATTKGLGESFAERAKRLAGSMWVWVGVLFGSLLSGAVLSLVRLNALKKVLETATPNMGLVWVNILLGILSIAGPVWLAWVATKQIGQRFRLSEDYAFKAAVAKAYEGYRREAARLDESFAKELFGSALSRLDEAPLRYVEHETYGSPLHEMTATKAGQKPTLMANAIAHVRKRKPRGDGARNEAEVPEGE